MAVVPVHPTVSRVWAAHEEIRQAVGRIRSLLAEMSEIEDEDGTAEPVAGSTRIERLILGLLSRLDNLHKEKQGNRDFAAAIASRATLREEWTRLADDRAWIQLSLQTVFELLGSANRPDTAGWREIERLFTACEQVISQYLAEDFDLLRRGLEWYEPDSGACVALA